MPGAGIIRNAGIIQGRALYEEIFVTTRVSLHTLVIFVRIAHLILYLAHCISCDWESNADKLWHIDALIYVDDGWFAITAIDAKLGCQSLVSLGYLSGFPIPAPLYYGHSDVTLK